MIARHPHIDALRFSGPGAYWFPGSALAVSLVLVCVSMLSAACGQVPRLTGTDLGRDPAPDFRLIDQRGQRVGLSDLNGRPIVLTFLFTHCPDVCPLIAEHLHTAMEQLGNTADQIAFVAISVDPEHDTPESISTFNEQHRVGGRLRYLTGTREQLKPVWAAYYIGADTASADPESITHSTRVILIDKGGRQRVHLDSDFDPADLANNLRVLLAE